MQLATTNKKRVSTYFGGSKWFLGKCSQLRVNDHLLGKSYFLGRQIYHFYGSIITLSNPTGNLGMSQTPPLYGNAMILEAPVIASPRVCCASNLKCTLIQIDCVNVSVTAGDANGWSADEREMNSLSCSLFVQTPASPQGCKISQILLIIMSV